MAGVNHQPFEIRLVDQGFQYTQARRVIDVEQGRSEQTVIDFSYKLEEKGGSCEKVRFATSDMSKAYRSGVQECFPNAKLTIDKFHVKS